MLINKIINFNGLNEKIYLSVYLNFTEDNRHGCIKNCSFCAFKLNPVYMCPTEEDLKEFFSLYKNRLVTNKFLLSGGGDPLFEFEKNKDKVLMIFNVAKQFGLTPVLQSYELDTIDKYFNTLFKDVDTYYFSVEGYDEKLIKLADKLLKNNKEVHISKIFNFSNKIQDINYTNIHNWINMYIEHSSALHLHENYQCCFKESESIRIQKYFRRLQRRKYPNNRLYFHIHKYTRNWHLVLINNEVWIPFEYFHIKLLHDFDNIEGAAHAKN